MAYRYTIRRLNELTEPSRERGLAVTASRLWSRIKRTTSPPYVLEYEGEKGRSWPSAFRAAQRVRQIMRREHGPDRIIVRSAIGPDYAVRKFVRNETPPVPDGVGTAAIDKIHAAVIAFCLNKGWKVTELGICVNKPGEHGHCNAWDGGVIYEGGSMLPADEIHRRNIAVATFIRDEGLAGNLPVNGVIVMSQYWEQGMGKTWRPYSGTPHVSHWHVSGWPSYTGWV